MMPFKLLLVFLIYNLYMVDGSMDDITDISGKGSAMMAGGEKIAKMGTMGVQGQTAEAKGNVIKGASAKGAVSSGEAKAKGFKGGSSISGGAAVGTFKKAGIKKGRVNKLFATGHDRSFSKTTIHGHDRGFTIGKMAADKLMAGGMAGMAGKKYGHGMKYGAGFDKNAKAHKKGFAAAGGLKANVKKGAASKAAFKGGKLFKANGKMKKIADNGMF